MRTCVALSDAGYKVVSIQRADESRDAVPDEPVVNR
jgi:hypothetical protein